jgi:hypothetical protein
MTYSLLNHPSEDSLISCALQGGDDEVRQHLEECQACLEYTEEIREIGEDIRKIEEEEIPPGVQSRILSMAKKKTGMENVFLFLRDWYKKPFIYGLLSALAAIMFYFAFELLHLD